MRVPNFKYVDCKTAIKSTNSCDTFLKKHNIAKKILFVGVVCIKSFAILYISNSSICQEQM